MVPVKQPLPVAIILLLLIAICGVLLTPDPGDDPAGVVVQLQKGRLPFTALALTQAVSATPLAATSQAVFFRSQVPATIAKLDLICTRLC